MLRLRDASLRTRLVLLTLASSSVGLVLAFALFAMYDEHLFREHKVEELRSAAEMIAATSKAALIFDDEQQGARVLRGLESRNHIGQGVLYRADGTVLSEYLRGGFESHIVDDVRVVAESVTWKGEYLQLSRPISFQGRQVGVLCLESEMGDLREERRQLAKVMLGHSC